VRQLFREQADLAAVFGSYNDAPAAQGVISQYRNLLHHFTHQNGNPQASTFWAGCGAIRRSIFKAIGGFDEKRFPHSSIEDIELGYRLRAAGYRILLDKSIQGTHLKHWTLFSLIRTDILRRAIPWARLNLETGKVPADLNLKWGQKASVALISLAGVLLSLSLLWPELFALCIAVVLTVLFLNLKLYAFFFRRKGLFLAIACIPLHLLYFLYNGLSYLYVWVNFRLKRAVST